MNTRAARSIRGAAFAAVATLSAALAHTLGGGGAPSPLYCLVLAALVLPVTVALAGSRVRAWRTWAALGAAQLAFHLAFAVTGDIPLASAGATTGRTHAGHDAFAAIAAGEPAAAPSLLMTLAHLVAAVTTVLAVRHGERVGLRILGWVRHALRRIDAPVPAIQTRRPLPAHRRALPLAQRVARSPLSRRGPPSWLAPTVA